LIEEQENQKVLNIANFSNIDCRDLIKQADRDIKVLNYKLGTVISSGDNLREIILGNTIEIDAFDDTEINFKVKVKGMPTPAKFIFEYKTKGDLKASVSKAGEKFDQNGGRVYMNVTIQSEYFSQRSF
jgi:hypothetical protein